ncbi:maleylpyruvate isomerase family mycothiol-dependent enzyme [Streptomyces sp. 8K308]|uniref:maleylpyruvate isomerase family mycothiol-dependent enzyme n=1 Tax=Streptomyces sp. 8K308 TaxID=2530388 RepID=UPI001A9D1115|nr:maleylpyruvate isomerase family mycothiol-dependent enzyme [Streptomyces sp. 8K308]
MALSPPATEDRVRDAVFAAQDRLRALLPGLTDAAAREPSALPGWSRAHVLSHLEGVGLALARQAEFASRGELVDVYDGGRPARDAGIEAGARRDAAALRAALTAALDRVRATWAAVGPDEWDRPVRYRQGPLRGALLAWWREAEIHTADALLGATPADWSRAFCGHTLDFLAPRVPADTRLVLVATDGPERREFGTGPQDVVVRGPLTDLTAWLAGRAPAAPPRPETGELPQLDPWP